jgi:predicted CoA-binding protein
MDYNSAEMAHDMRRSRLEATMFADDAGEVCELPLRSQERSIYQDETTIQRIVRSARVIAVVGLSANPCRPSNEVARYLQRQGLRIVPVNPNITEALGEHSYPSLHDIPFPIDVVDVFRRPAAVPGVAEGAVAIGAKALWLQLGVINREGAEIARRSGLDVVMERCLKVEWMRNAATTPR